VLILLCVYFDVEGYFGFQIRLILILVFWL